MKYPVDEKSLSYMLNQFGQQFAHQWQRIKEREEDIAYITEQVYKRISVDV